ncbi:MAG: hypothetical protein JO051_07190, partial [Acidobacteriaceae bacterium]|nr:hypothetical protein [Acidobacteriaceae bacterium]
MPFDVSHPEVRDVVLRALEEDIGSGDLTTKLCVPASRRATARLLARQRMVVAGVELLPLIAGFGVDVTIHEPSGSAITANTTVATLRGPARKLLSTERTALNFVQRLSAIATLANAFVKRVEG